MIKMKNDYNKYSLLVRLCHKVVRPAQRRSPHKRKHRENSRVLLHRFVRRLVSKPRDSAVTDIRRRNGSSQMVTEDEHHYQNNQELSSHDLFV
jgi:hypothetical protein